MSAEPKSPVAIVGIGCRFPGGANDPESFWQLLNSGNDPISRLPEGRFDVDRFIDPTPGTPGKLVTADGGFLEGIDQFDAAFFGLSPREARKIDPQHRLLLEVAWEALEDAGIPPSTLAGKRVGVYAGVWSGEYENVMYRTPEELDFHAITGGGRYAASGRISFAFDFRGPAVSVDTGCSASLVALHLARQAVESGEVDVAIAAAANLVLQPQVNIGYSRSGMLSAGARCRFGDADAAGYVRSDGVAAVVLKPLDSARASGDPVRGVLLATAVNADGKGSGQLATPSSDAQAALLETVYDRAGVKAAQVPYVEAHGTGTRAGDPVELEALGRVLGRGREAGHPLVVGSVKSVIGHTEAAAGMAGLIKTLLALEHGQIPPNLHLRTPSDAIRWDDFQVRIPTSPIPWPEDAPRVAGISSFGITGTNAHAIVAAASEVEPSSFAGFDPVGAETEAGPAVVTLSARTDAALTEAARDLRDWVAARLGAVGTAAEPSFESSEGDPSARRLWRLAQDDNGGGTAAAQDDNGILPRLTDISYTTTCRREQMASRMAIVADNSADLVQALDEHLAGESSGRIALGVAPEGLPAPRVAFVFSGQGSQWLGMGQELLGRAPMFTALIDRCDALLRGATGWSLREALAGAVDGAFERVDLVQPVLTCVQIALAEQLRAWGIVPAAVVGHSMGEVAAAYVARALSLEDSMRVIVTRSRLLSQIAGAGAMALVDLPEEELAQLLAESGAAVSVASVNGPRSTVMSGDPAAVDALLAKLDAEGVFCRRVKVDVASHSVQTDPLLAPLREALSGIEPRTPEVAFYSTARPGAPVDLLVDAHYWVDNLRQPVQLMTAVGQMVADDIDTFVEIAPHPVLLSSLGDIAADANASVRTLAGPRREEPEMRRMLDLLARLHVGGAPVDWHALAAPGARPLRLPHYPWQRERHWLELWEDWSGDDRSARRAAPRPERLGELAYRIEWQPYEPGSAAEISGERWVVIGDPDGLGQALAARIRNAGGVVEVLQHEGEMRPGSVAGVVDLRPTGLSAYTADEFEWAMSAAFGQATGTVSSLLDARRTLSRGTWLVTRGAQSVGERSAIPAASAQGAVWGAGRTSAAEHPELRIGLVDLDPTDSVETAAHSLWLVLSDPSTGEQIALDRGAPYRARLSRVQTSELNSPASWREDSTYLITGGLGALGLLVADEMVSGGARRLILSGRSGLPDRKLWSSLPADSPLRRQAEGVMALERRGVTVHLARFDVGDEAEISQFVRAFAEDGWPEIRGVVHCAGIFDAVDISREAFDRIARGKALGAYNLIRVLPNVEDLILFSSVSSVIPQPNLNYAAANAVLDSVAYAAAGLGSRTISLGWGAWAGVGMARDERIERYLKIVEGQGNSPLDAATAPALFTWTAAASVPHLVLADVDWAVAAQKNASFIQQPVFSQFVSDAPAAVEGRRSELLELSTAKRRDALSGMIRTILAEVLQLPVTTISLTLPFGKQGLDSLMGVEFRNRLEMELGLRLPASLAWNYPTVGVLAEHLSKLLHDSSDAPAPAQIATLVAEATPVAALVEELQEQSEEDVLRLLRGEVV